MLRGVRLAICSGSAATRVSCLSTGLNPQKKPAISQRVKFVDQVRIVARGGTGGGGSSALFGRTGHHPRAAGGNGGSGGSVLLRATLQLTGLGSIPLHVEGGAGSHGGKQWMDGKRGADRVVQVPLGTMVWRLVQLQGRAADAPHGVTPLPAPHTPVSQRQQQPAQERTAWDLSRSTEGRPLFAGPSLLQPQHNEAAAAAAAAAAARPPAPAAAAAAAAGPDPSTGNSVADPGAASCDGSDSQHVGGVLYQQLLSGTRQLSNQEKRTLLYFGSLHAPAAALRQQAVLSAADELQGSDEEHLGSELDDDDGSSSSSSDDGSAAQHLPDQGDTWGSLGEEGLAEERVLTKRQVWAALEAQAELLGVLDEEGQELLVAAGGRGGRGNALAPSVQQRPAVKTRSDGQPGQEVLLLLKLRLLADVVLVGLPNAGKSSLIAALTSARAQVGSYAFTTLRPQLGTLASDPAAQEAAGGSASTTAAGGTAESSTAAAGGLSVAAAAAQDTIQGLTGHRLVLADLPGLVPGAHAGRGRGHDFLKHLGKARCIALVVDMTGQAAEGRQSQQQLESAVQDDGSCAGAGAQTGVVVPHGPEQQLEILQQELRLYDASTLSLPCVVVANKVDALSSAAAAARLERLKQATPLPIVPVSAKQRLGLQRLKHALEVVAGSTPAA